MKGQAYSTRTTGLISTHKNGTTSETRTDMETGLKIKRIKEQEQKHYYKMDIRIKTSRTTDGNSSIKTQIRERTNTIRTKTNGKTDMSTSTCKRARFIKY